MTITKKTFKINPKDERKIKEAIREIEQTCKEEKIKEIIIQCNCDTKRYNDFCIESCEGYYHIEEMYRHLNDGISENSDYYITNTQLVIWFFN